MVYFVMDACVVRSSVSVLWQILLFLLKVVSLVNSSVTDGAYFTFSGTADSGETTALLQTLRTSTVQFTSTEFGHLTSAQLSEIHPDTESRESRTATGQNSFSTDMESWTSHISPEVSTELLSSRTELRTTTTADWRDASTVANITDTYLALTVEQQPATEVRTVRDHTAVDLMEQDNMDTDTTQSISHTDSTYISTTINRAGERTLLSVASNSTFPNTEESGSSETASQTVTSEVLKRETTQSKGYPEGALTTEADHTGTASEFQEFTNATHLPNVSQFTQSHTGQPNVTSPGFGVTSDSDSHNATLPVTVFNSSESETPTSVESSTSRTSYTDSSASDPASTPSFMSPEDTRTNSSHTSSETVTTETPAAPMNTVVNKIPGRPRTQMDETTITALTTALTSKTTVDNSLSEQPFVSQTSHPPETTEVLTTTAGPVTTAAEPITQRPQHTEQDTHVASTAVSTDLTTSVITTLASTSISTSALLTTHQVQVSTTAKMPTTHIALSTIEATQELTVTTTEQHHSTSKAALLPQSSSSSHPGDVSTDVSTLHLETSTATPGNTTAHSTHTTASYSKNTPTESTAPLTTGKHTEGGSTQMESTTKPISVKPTTSPDVSKGRSSPGPQDPSCTNMTHSFCCKCKEGFDLADDGSCTQARTFLGSFSFENSAHTHELQKEILQVLNTSLFGLHGYRRSCLEARKGAIIGVRNIFSMSANVTSSEIFSNICGKSRSPCSLKHPYQLRYQEKKLCLPDAKTCDTKTSKCSDVYGTVDCQCHPGFIKNNPKDTTCRECGDGFELINGTCVECTFGFGGFNCNNFYGLIAKVVAPATGGLLLIIIIALIITCCRKDKNDINKIIFKSGDLQMSPYAEFPKSSRVSMEWGRETIEMQENGSTKNLLQMTDIYYSPALRNADLERNGLYPFSGLPGSRHSCIYPAQWNPSFISDDSRRRDYF